MTLSHYTCLLPSAMPMTHRITFMRCYLPSAKTYFLLLYVLFTELDRFLKHRLDPLFYLVWPPSIPHVMLGDLHGPAVDHDLHLWPSLLAFDRIVAHFEDGVEYYIHLFIAWSIFLLISWMACSILFMVDLLFIAWRIILAFLETFLLICWTWRIILLIFGILISFMTFSPIILWCEGENPLYLLMVFVLDHVISS